MLTNHPPYEESEDRHTEGTGVRLYPKMGIDCKCVMFSTNFVRRRLILQSIDTLKDVKIDKLPHLTEALGHPVSTNQIMDNTIL